MKIKNNHVIQGRDYSCIKISSILSLEFFSNDRLVVDLSNPPKIILINGKKYTELKIKKGSSSELTIKHYEMGEEEMVNDEGVDKIRHVLDRNFNIVQSSYSCSDEETQWFKQNSVELDFLGNIVNEEDLIAYKMKFGSSNE